MLDGPMWLLPPDKIKIDVPCSVTNGATTTTPAGMDRSAVGADSATLDGFIICELRSKSITASARRFSRINE